MCLTFYLESCRSVIHCFRAMIVLYLHRVVGCPIFATNIIVTDAAFPSCNVLVWLSVIPANYLLVEIYCITNVHFYSRPRIAPSISEDCYILSMFYLFFPPQFFDVPGLIFTKLCHTMRCVLKIFCLLYGCSCVPPKNLRGEKPQFLLIFGPKINTLSSAVP